MRAWLPIGLGLRGRRTRQRDQLRFLLAIELAVLPAGGLLAMQRRIQAFGGELLTHTLDGHARGVQRLGDPLVRPSVGAVGVGLEQDVRPPSHRGGVGAGVNEPLERPALLSRESNDNLMTWSQGQSSLKASRKYWHDRIQVQ